MASPNSTMSAFSLLSAASSPVSPLVFPTLPNFLSPPPTTVPAPPIFQLPNALFNLNLAMAQNTPALLPWLYHTAFLGYTEPQMNTPDDPVIHSPQSSLGNPLLNNPGYNASLGQTKMEDSMSPEANGDPNDLDARRRQKTCRVCGDHATGYNFNVITCESCKAFFRRNALRPKEFKCPYSEDCEINAVSRRFCQKCRLRKCFTVGMKKEWILNEEQLRRRKNSRLNNLANQQRQKHHQVSELMRQQQLAAVKAMASSPLSISPMEAQLNALGARGGIGSLVSPPNSQGYLMSPTGSSMTDSPPNRQFSNLMGGGIAAQQQRSPEAYDTKEMLTQRFRGPLPPEPTLKSIDHRKDEVTLSMADYQNLLQMAHTGGLGKHPLMVDDELPSKRQVYAAGALNGNGGYHQNMSMSGLTTYTNLPEASGPIGSSSAMAELETKPDISCSMQNLQGYSGQQQRPQSTEEQKRMSTFLDNTIKDALNIDSPEAQPNSLAVRRGTVELQNEFGPSGAIRNMELIKYQLTPAELRELDKVKDAFAGMDEKVGDDQERQRTSLLKNDKSPADIMNIMDVIMRRLVKVSKKLNGFNDLSQEGKFKVLKASMVDLLTIRGVTRFDCSSGVWRTPTAENAEVGLGMFDQLNEQVRNEQKTRFLRFFKLFHEDIRTNQLAINLIMLIVLFSVVEKKEKDAPGSSRQYLVEGDCQLVSKSFVTYKELYLRYLQSIYGEDAMRIYSYLPLMLDALREISKNAAALFVGAVDASKAEPLPMEFFNV